MKRRILLAAGVTLWCLGAAAPLAAQDTRLDPNVVRWTRDLLTQVRVLTHPAQRPPSRVLPIEPCPDKRSRQSRIASMEPMGLLIRAWHEWATATTINSLDNPIPVCFPFNARFPERGDDNIIQFNAAWHRRRYPEQNFRLEAVSLQSEISPAALGRRRAEYIIQTTDQNLQPRLEVCPCTSTPDPDLGRWVRWVRNR